MQTRTKKPRRHHCARFAIVPSHSWCQDQAVFGISQHEFPLFTARAVDKSCLKRPLSTSSNSEQNYLPTFRIHNKFISP